MMAKPIKTLELHYPMIQLLIITNILKSEVNNYCFSIITQVNK